MFCDRDHKGQVSSFSLSILQFSFPPATSNISAVSLLASFSVGLCTAASAALSQHQSCHSGQEIYTCLIVHMMMPGQPQQ